MQGINDVWPATLRRVWQGGNKVSPRGEPTREVLASTIGIDMQYPVLTLPARNVGYRFMANEAAWSLAGRNDLERIGKYSKLMRRFSDDGKTLCGASGPRVMAQVNPVIQALQQDLMTRQAVINIWRENPPESKDIPCTLSCSFLVRGKKLHC